MDLEHLYIFYVQKHLQNEFPNIVSYNRFVDYADKGYISKELMALLFGQGLHLITGINNNMNNVIMTMNDKILHRKWSVIETIND